jgi:SAM-dependent methyltransferase
MLDAGYYDRWYSDVIQSPARDAIVQRTLGLPRRLQSTGALGWDALAEVVVALRLSRTDTVLDLACGRGGYGMEIIRRTGARMVGVDFSAVAIQQARCQAEACGLTGRTEFLLGDMADTGLDASSVDAVLCVDSIHFANPISVILRECQRVLKPRGRVVLTAWQLVDAADEQLRQRSGHRDLAVELESAGFEQVQVSEKPAWHAAERAMWLEAASVDAGDDPALQTMQDEAQRVLSVFDMRQRVLATAIVPV